MRRPLIFAILAGFAAVLAAVIVFSALKRREAEVQKALASTVEIVVAAHDLSLGARIDSSAVKLTRWSRDSVPAGAFTDPQALVNSFARSEIVANEPIVATKLFMGEKTSGVMPLLIPDGMRAMAVPVDEVSDIAGFVQPRSHVDVLVSVSGSGRDVPSFSKVVLQDIEVLAVAQEIEKKNDQPEIVKVVTLLVTPAQAEKLALATHEGQLHLAMRNYSDSGIVMTNGAEMRDLHGIDHGIDAPAIHDQAAAAPARVRQAGAPRRALSVVIMRDGKSAESVSFLKSGLFAGRLSRATEPQPSVAAQSAPLPASTPAAPARGAALSSPPHGARASDTIMAAPILAHALEPGGAPQTDGSADQPPPAQDGAAYVPAPKTLTIP
ncbi:MAG TPA: Flp pilus assembly protein CpaB [Candidatus Binataceae bacterium]|nr:Flp pilus assembly protein CpaB [Candidatus Binataceae bacterium]